MAANACDDVFGWVGRDPGGAMFAAQAGGAWQPVTAFQFAALGGGSGDGTHLRNLVRGAGWLAAE